MPRKTEHMRYHSPDMKYYSPEIKALADSVKRCDGIEFLDKMEFFIAESNEHMAGIDDGVQERIRYYSRKFKEQCKCINR